MSNYSQGLPDELIDTYYKNHCSLKEWAGYRLWSVEMANGSSIIVVARKMPDFNAHIEVGHDGELIPKLIPCGDKPFERTVRVDMVISVGALHLSEKKELISHPVYYEDDDYYNERGWTVSMPGMRDYTED